MKRLLTAALLLILSASVVTAQTDTTTTTTTTIATQNVQIFFVACADQAVINLSGVMTAGWDVYYQVFSGAGGTGTPLTGVRQVQVDGTYAFSERARFAEGTTIAGGAIGSARVFIGRETNSATTDFDTTVDDVQDGCSTPQNAEGTSVDLGGTGGGGVDAAAPTIAATNPIVLAPGGAELNPNRVVPVNQVVIGARQSDNYRSDTPGLVFAECDAFTRTIPGVVYDTDNIVIFWSWFAKTEDTMAQHLANANYAVKLNQTLLPNANLSIPEVIRRDVWVFYTVPIGNLLPGHYEVEFKLSWDQAISDGYDEFGPGTPTEQVNNLCNFDVIRNPNGINVNANVIYQPTDFAVHDLQPEF